MASKYWRVTYDGIGVYEALKKKVWDDNSDFSKEHWENFKKSDDVTWLKVPSVYGNDCYSYFTEDGFSLFMKKTYPLIIKWLDKEKIEFNEYFLCVEQMHLVYNDEYQIVVERRND